MADATSTFGIDIEETGGDDAAGSLEALRDKMAAANSSAAELSRAMRNLRMGGQGASEAYAELKEQLQAARAASAQATSEFVSAGGVFEKSSKRAGGGLDALTEAAEESAMSEQQLLDVLKGTLGPLGGVFEKAGLVSKGLGGMSVVAVAAAGAFLMLAAAVVAGLAKLTAFALASADAARSAALTVAAVSRTSESLSGLANILPAVRAATGLAAGDLTDLAKQLSAAGVSAADMPAALRAVATAEAALGKGGASELIEQMKAGKKSASELAAEMDQKFGGVVKAKLLSLDAQTARFHESLGQLFAGINLDKFLGGLDQVLSLFGQTTATGRALRTLFTTIFQPLFDGAAAVAPYVKAAFQGIVIGALQIAIVVAKVKAAISSAFGGSVGSIVSLSTVLQGAKVLVYVLAAAFANAAVMMGATMAVVGIAAGIAAGIIRRVVAVVQAVGAAFSWLGGVAAGAWDGVVGALSAAWSAVTGFLGQFTSAGANLIAGFVQGILGGAGAVINAILAPIKGGVAAVKSFLGIASPSKLMASMGGHTAAGFAVGLDAGTGDVADAAGGLAAAAADGVAGAPGPAGKAGSPAKSAAGGREVTLTVNVNATGAGAADIALAVRQAVAAFFEDTALEAGAGAY